MRSFNLSLAAIAIGATLFLGCSDSGDTDKKEASEGTVKLSGTFGAGYAFAPVPKWYDSILSPLYAASGFNEIKKVVAVPIVNGYEVLMHSAQALQVDEDGSFSAELESNYSWVVLLERNDNSIDFITIPAQADSNTTLVNIPIDAATEDLDLGTITNGTVEDEATASATLQQLSPRFTFSDTDLQFMADMDNTFKSVSNAYVNNYGTEYGEGIGETLNVVAVATQPLSDSEYIQADNYRGFGLSFEAGSKHDLNKASQDICAAKNDLTLLAPGGTTFKTTTTQYDRLSTSQSSLISETDKSCRSAENEPLFLGIDHGKFSFFGGEERNSLLQNTQLSTQWYRLQLDGKEIAKFHLNYNLPLHPNGAFNIPVPKIKISHDDQGLISKIDVNWVLYNSTEQRYKPLPLSKIGYLLHDLDANIAFFKEDINCALNKTLSEVDLNQCNSEVDKLEYNITGSPTTVHNIAIQYHIGSTYVRFNFSKNGYAP